MTNARLARLPGELAEIATGSASLVSYRKETLALLQQRIGFDRGTLQNRVGATG